MFVRSQHHRHRTWSYNEISRRYTDHNIEFYIPKEFRTQHKSNRQASNNELIDPAIDMGYWSGTTKAAEMFEEHCAESRTMFEAMIEAGVCREQARAVLPQAMYVEYYATANLNNILKFIDLRSHEGAQWEIQKLSDAMLEIISDLWPVTIKKYKERVQK